MLRAGARIFLGCGDADDPSLSHEPQAADEEPEKVPGRVSPPLLFGPALALMVVGLGLAFTPGLAGRATQWAQRFENRPAHAAEVLRQRFENRPAHAAEVLRGVVPPAASAPAFHPGAAPYVYGAISTVGAVAFALFGLYRRRLPALLRRGRDVSRPGLLQG